MYTGKLKLVRKYLSFLENEYNMTFSFQSFNDFRGFVGPSDCYSFYNDNGCFTIHNLVQKDEWGIYVCDTFCKSQYSLLSQEINLADYDNISGIGFFLKSRWLNYLGKIIKKQIILENSFFGIKV